MKIENGFVDVGANDSIMNEKNDAKNVAVAVATTAVVVVTEDKFAKYRELSSTQMVYKVNETLESAYVDEIKIDVRTRAAFVENFKQNEVKTAKATLDLCRVVYEANKVLNSYEFQQFCIDVGHRDYSSTIRKFIAIGKVYPRFISYAENMPSSWTSIYQITQIPAEIFDQCVKNKRSFKEMTGSKIVEMIKETKNVNKISDFVIPVTATAIEKNIFVKKAVVGKIYFTQSPDNTDWRALQKAIAEVEARLPIKIKLTEGLNDIFAKRKAQNYAKAKKVYANPEFKPATWDLGVEANATGAANETNSTDAKEEMAA